jgi:hypothetical protein
MDHVPVSAKEEHIAQEIVANVPLIKSGTKRVVL